MFKFLHTADIHLDSPLRGLDSYEGAPADQIRSATRRALENLTEVATREEVAFVVIAGDLYDGDWRDFNTGLFFVKQMAILREAGIRVFGVQGNHDAASKITRRLPLPENVHFFPTAAAETLKIDELDVAIHGQSFAEQCTTSDLAKNYPAAITGYFNLGVLHTSMSGREGHGSYAPCSEACLRESGYDYWALGHIHQREILPGTTTIAYPGNPQGRHIRETGAKGCLLVQVDDNLNVNPIFEPLDVLRWELIEVKLDEVAEKNEVLERVGDGLRKAMEQAEGRFVAVRVLLNGMTPLANLLSAKRREFNADIRALAVDIGMDSLWVEKVKHETTLPIEPIEKKNVEDETPWAEVVSLVNELSASEMTGSKIGIDLSDLERKLPTELSDALRSADPAWWNEILREAESRLMIELRG